MTVPSPQVLRERAPEDPRPDPTGARPTAHGNPPHAPLRDAALTAVREALVTLRAGLAPLGRVRPLPPVVARPDGPPVVLVHGYMATPEALRPLARTLLGAGRGPIVRVGYPSLTVRFEELLARIEAAVVPLADTHGPVDLVGHSLGALASRAWIKLRGGAPRVRRFVSLGGPHGGTAWAVAVPSPVREAFDPEGPWIRQLAEGPEPVPTTVVRARFDHQVLPPERAAIPGAHEVIVDAWGHNGLLWSLEAHGAVLAALRESDAAEESGTGTLGDA